MYPWEDNLRAFFEEDIVSEKDCFLATIQIAQMLGLLVQKIKNPIRAAELWLVFLENYIDQLKKGE